MQGHLLDEFRVEAYTTVELGAVRQGRECLAQMAAGVAVEIPLTGKSRPPGEDSEGYDFAGTERGIGTWAASLSRTRLVEIVHHDVECGEEGVLRSSIRVRFLSLGDW
jgi:hypothetical protein